MLSDPTALREAHERQLDVLRERLPLDSFEGTFDIYPVRQAIFVASRLPFRPRPVFQSYAAFTESLARRNREHLRGPRAPESILFAVDTIDGRYPALDDGLSWPELLTRYRVDEKWVRGLYILRREESARAYDLVPLVEREAKLGDTIEIPRVSDGAAVWAEIDVRPSFAGRLLRAAYKLPRLWFEVTATKPIDSQPERFRWIAEMGRAGFVLSPIVASSADFEQLAGSGEGDFWQDRRVQQVRLGFEDDFGASWAYDTTVRVRLFELAFERSR